MPLTKATQSNAIFLSIKHHCLWQELKQPTTDSVQIEVTNPETKEVKTKHGLQYKDVAGYISDMERYDRTFGAKRFSGYKIKLNDGEGGTYYLDMSDGGQLARKFLRVMHNIDPMQMLRINVWRGKNEEKNDYQTAILFAQGADNLRYYYTKTDPHGMPDATQNARTKKWDYSAQEDFLYQQLEEVFIPRVRAAAEERKGLHFEPPSHFRPVSAHTSGPDQSDDEYDGPPNSTIDDDDVPF